MNRSPNSNKRRPGNIRKYIGVGIMALGSILAYKSAVYGTMEAGRPLKTVNQAEKAFYDKANDPSISDAVFKQIERQDGAVYAIQVQDRIGIPQEGSDELTRGCKAELSLNTNESKLKKCEELGSALYNYRYVWDEFTNNMSNNWSATDEDSKELLVGCASVFAGFGVVVSGLYSSSKYDDNLEKTQ